MEVLQRGLLYILTLHTRHSYGLAEFDMFPGFDSDITTMMASTQNYTMSPSNVTDDVTNTTSTLVTNPFPTTTQKSKATTTVKREPSTTNQPLHFSNTIPYKPHVCPEEERPSNIGPYEVPTQRDLVLHLKTALRTRFNAYHKKALFLLNDIKEATRATSSIEAKCPSKNRHIFKQCVKHVNNQCQTITKGLVTSLELQRHDVEAFTEFSICDFPSMKADPVQLIKTLAMEEASLDFALSGFLRLLSACARYCKNDNDNIYRYKPARHMSDQDLVIKHFLSRKNYVQLLRETPL